MIYMVEMALLDPARRAEWDAWYVAHQHRLLSIPGFRATQRFEAIHAAQSPFVALHEVDAPEIFDSPAYRAKAGPGNTGEWQTRMGHWHRNLFAAAHTPDVPMDARLVVTEEDGAAARAGDVPVTWMDAVGLDRSVRRRGLAVMPPATAERLVGAPGIRVLKPLGPRLQPRINVHRRGNGPDVVLFHGGMGSWRHWIRNVEALATRFTVSALDHPAYGASAAVARDTTGPAYLDLVHDLFVEMFPGEAPLRLGGFSFGGAIAASLARRLAPRVTHLCLVSPGGFPARRFGERPTRSYREAGDDETRFREICRHNLRINMLRDPASVTEEAVDIQAYGVRHARFDSRKVSGGGTLLTDLARLGCRIRLLWGEGDDSAFRPASLLIDEIRAAVPRLDLHRIPRAGHWSAYENAGEVNRLMLEFFSI